MKAFFETDCAWLNKASSCLAYAEPSTIPGVTLGESGVEIEPYERAEGTSERLGG